jgi:hypothetical protein
MAATAFSPILTADGDGAGERVDLGMAGPSLTDPAKNELECRRETVVVCRVCHRAYAKYTCPRCHTKYCDLACYKTHDPRCVESFHGDNLGNAMKGLRVEDEEKRRVTVLLAKYAPGGDSSRGGVPGETSGGSSETSSSESDESEEEDWDGDGLGDGFETKSGETKKNEKNNKRKNNARCVLSAANLRKLAAGETLVLADFTPDTLSKFERAARTGELSHMIHAWVPWWTSCSARDVALARNGSAMVEVRWVKSYGHSVRTNQDGDGNEDGVVGDETDKSNDDEPQIPAPPDEPLPPLASLLPPNVAPSAALRWHVLDVLAAYACVARVCDGEWRENPLSAARDLLAFSPTLAESAKGRGVGDVGDDAIDDRDHLAHGRAPATASGAMAGVAEAVTAAGATRAVAAAAAAAAARYVSGLSQIQVHCLLPLFDCSSVPL